MPDQKHVTEFNDYKKFILHQVAVNGSVRGYQAELARAAGCQSSYLSQALRGHVHLTPDHGAGLCHFWQLNELETDYFLELLQLGRAASRKLVAVSNRRLDTMRRKHLDLSDRFKSSRAVRLEDQMIYFSAWHWAAIHGLCSVHGFQTVPRLSERLGISAVVIQDVLVKLQRMGLVQSKGSIWSPAEKDIHLPKESSMIVAHHHNWRLRGVLNAQQSDTEAVHYTALYAISREDFEHIRREVVKLVDESRSRAVKSKEGDVYALCCDWFAI